MTDTAIDYVTAGWALINIPKGKKGPATTGWNEEANAITDPERAGQLNGNIGIAHAYCSPLPTMALDIDDLPKARAFLSDYGIDLDSLLDADDAVQIASGKKDSRKLLFRLPEGTSPIPTKQITDPETGQMILEFRCATANGLTVQDVLPPSLHPETGKPYQWAGKGTWRTIPTIPAALLTVWQSLLKPAPTQQRGGGANADDSSVITLSPETIQHLRSALLSMRADDYKLWIDCGMALKTLGEVGRGLWLQWSLTSEKSQDD
ncbi:bifunctional DNA primase/polymerase [Sphingorhabdus sp.]|uniref:bifunctional DNA primase/polymerase n=1 Tax=Sphingorhabdus sp. TaxID=1902408 RepID=UPI0040484205